jgi:hypothetical protein
MRGLETFMLARGLLGGPVPVEELADGRPLNGIQSERASARGARYAL